MSAGVLEEAEKHVKSAEKKLKKSLFGKWSISQNDYDIAALEFEKAAKLYQHLKKYDKSLEIWELCAENHGKALMPYSEGKAYESIATVYKELKNEEQQVNYTKKAGIAFGEDGKPDKQAGAYVRAARLCRDNDVKTAAALVKEALEILNESENHYLMPEPGRLLVAINTKAGLYLEAVESVKYNLGHLEALEQKHNINKAAVEVVVLHLARNDTVMAERDYKELAGKFSLDSDEASLCEDLIDAFQQLNAEQLAEVVGRQLITFIHPDIARLAKKLKISGAEAKSPTHGQEKPEKEGDDIEDWM